MTSRTSIAWGVVRPGGRSRHRHGPAGWDLRCGAAMQSGGACHAFLASCQRRVLLDHETSAHAAYLFRVARPALPAPPLYAHHRGPRPSRAGAGRGPHLSPGRVLWEAGARPLSRGSGPARGPAPPVIATCICGHAGLGHRPLSASRGRGRGRHRPCLCGCARGRRLSCGLARPMPVCRHAGGRLGDLTS